jgi:hypothetical protein
VAVGNERCEYYLWDGRGAIDDLEDELSDARRGDYGAEELAVRILRGRAGDSTLWVRSWPGGILAVRLVAVKMGSKLIYAEAP